MAGPYSAQGGHLGIKTQAVKGTYADPGTSVPPGVFCRLRTGSMGTDRTLLMPDAEIGGSRDLGTAELGPMTWSATYSMYGRMDSLATLLYGAMGAVTDTHAGTGSTQVGTHVVGSNDTLPWLSIEEQIGGSGGWECMHYTDAKIDTLTLTLAANGYLDATAMMGAITGVAGATPTILANQAYDTTPMIVGTSSTVTFGGVTLPAKDIKFEIKNNLDLADFRLGSFVVGSMVEKMRSLIATVTIRPNDSSIWREAVFGTSTSTTPQGSPTPGPLVITMHTWEVIGTTVTPYSLNLSIPVGIIKPFKVNSQHDNPIDNVFDIQAFRPVVATDVGTFTVVNDLAATA